MSRSQRVKEHFINASELRGDERAAYLDRLASEEPELLEDVRSLLEMDEDEDDPLTRGASENTRLLMGRVHEAVGHAVAGGMGIDPPGSLIGPYRLVSVLGEGGFGIVHLAEQTAPVRRQVALKVLKPGMDSRAVIARFEAERQALAMMDHPGVASVFDAGTNSRGLPYFVMEYMPGEPITRFCDAQRLTLRQRLELFASVCEAVQHAHTKGIIHRDLKPSNVLVNTDDSGRPVAKVIDFGIAKAVEQPLTDSSLHTEQGQIIGTPEYMSPEQAGAAGHDVDTRTDVYALGVILYELIAGALPFSPELLRTAGLFELPQIIREQEPARPATRLSGLSDTRRDEVAHERAISGDALRRELRGELSWIPLKALRKNPDERYRSAAEFADDVRHYLTGLPLTAGPETTTYKARKFLRRHGAAVAVASAMVLLLIAGIIGTSIGLTRAIAQADRAEAANARTGIRHAHSMIRLGDIRRATQALGAIPAARRDWEWHYLDALADSSVREIDFAPGAVHHVETGVGGRTLVRTSDDRAWLLSLDRAEPTRIPVDDVICAAISPTNPVVALGVGESETAYSLVLLDLETGDRRTMHTGTNSIVLDLDFSADGSRLCAVEPLRALVWDLNVESQGPSVLQVPGRNQFVGASLNLDGSQLASRHASPQVHLWDVDASRELGFRVHSQPVTDLEFDNATGTLLLGSTDGQLLTWEVSLPFDEAEATVLYRTDQSVNAVHLDASGRRYAALDSGGIIMIDLYGEAIEMLGHSQSAQTIATLDEHGLLLSGSDDTSLRLWPMHPTADSPLRSYAPIRLRAHRRGVSGLAFNDDGTLLACVSPNSPRAFLANTADWSPLTTQPMRFGATDVVFESDGTMLVGTQYAEIWSWAPADTTGDVRISEVGPTVASATNGVRAFGGGTRNTDADVVLHRPDGTTLTITTREHTIDAIGFSEDGTLIAWADAGGHIGVHSTDDGAVAVSTEAPNPRALAFQPGTSRLAIGTGDHLHGTVRLIDPTGSKDDLVLTGHRQWINALAFHPSGHRLASASADNTVVLWDLESGEALLELDGGRMNTFVRTTGIPYVQGLICLAFSPDGTQLAAGHEDGTVLIWDTVPTRDRFGSEFNSRRTSRPGSRAGR